MAHAVGQEKSVVRLSTLEEKHNINVVLSGKNFVVLLMLQVLKMFMVITAVHPTNVVLLMNYMILGIVFLVTRCLVAQRWVGVIIPNIVVKE